MQDRPRCLCSLHTRQSACATIWYLVYKVAISFWTTSRNYTLDFLQFCNPYYKVTMMVRVANLQKKLVCRMPLLARALSLKAKQSSRNAKRDVRVSVYKQKTSVQLVCMQETFACAHIRPRNSR